jgi:hypothetical protein
VALLALSRHLSFHARGDAAFVWHGLTGDVAEMSRDVLSLLLAFDPPAAESSVLQAPPAGLTREQVEEFVPILRSRRFLVAGAAGGQTVDEYTPLLSGYPKVPRSAVFRRRGAHVTVYGRGTPMELDARTAALFVRCDGERTLGQVLGDAGPAALPPLLRLARADVAALKILAKAVSHGGVALNPAAESTMPYPELADARAYAAGAPPTPGEPDPGRQDGETTLAHLFRAPHASLKGRTFGAALAEGLLRRGALQHVKGRPGRVLVHPSGELAEAIRESLARSMPADLSDKALPASEESAGGLETRSEGERVVNEGALELVRAAAAALAPGGTLALIEIGDPTSDPVRGDRGEWSIRFADLQQEAARLGLRALTLPLSELLSLDGAPQALSTTRASFGALRALFASEGLQLTRRAWLRSEIEELCKGKLDLSEVHGLQWAPLAERTLGLSPRQYHVLLAHKPERVLH